MNKLSVVRSLRTFATTLLVSAAAVSLSVSPGRAQVSGTAPAPVPVAVPRKAPPIVIIKVDDLRRQGDTVHARWQRLASFAKERKLKTSIGIIADSLDGDHPKYFQWIKDLQATRLFEFWDHGLDHKEWTENGVKMQEFKGPSYEKQKEHLTRSGQLAREKLGFPFRTFGAPFNATDDSTARALKENKDIWVWLYGDVKSSSDKIVMTRAGDVNIENPIFTPSLAKFVEGYNRHPDRAYFVIQGHPQQWDEAKFAQFVAIVDFLTKEKAVFMTPLEYARAMISPLGTPVKKVR